MQVNGSELVRGIGGALPPTVTISGGLAADGSDFGKTWVLANGAPSPATVSAVGFYGDRIRVGHGCCGGWDVFGPERIVTRAEGNRLYELDGEPALPLYRKYLGELARDLPASALLFPLALREDGEPASSAVVRTILAVDDRDQSMTFAGDIPNGMRAQLMRANFERIIDGAERSALMTRDDASDASCLCLAISCVGRRLVLGARTEEELERVSEFLSDGSTVVGFYSYGEISPHVSRTVQPAQPDHDPDHDHRGLNVHSILTRQLKRLGIDATTPPPDARTWEALLLVIDRTYTQADDDRYLLERSLSLSSDEMSELHARLATERDTINAVICSLDEGVCAVDAGGSILFINPIARELMGLAPDTPLTGSSLYELVDARLEDGRALGTIVGPGRTEIHEARLIIEQDESSYITCTTVPLGESGDGVVLTLRDITDQKRLERERSELDRQLLETSHRAGMAEVATCVLHNVGNVLNSVNVSASVIAQSLSECDARTISAIAAQLPGEPDELASFLTEDSRGRLIPDLLRELGTHSETLHDSITRELTELTRNVEHIRHIVSSQQAYARAGALQETIDLRTLITEAVKINEAGLDRHGVDIDEVTVDAPHITVDPHKLLQVLINLIANAKLALAGKYDGDRLIRLEAFTDIRDDEAFAVIRVIDNGEGIPRREHSPPLRTRLHDA